MSISSETSGPETDDVVPLLSDAAKGFLDGKIDAAQYVQITRPTTTDRARKEFYRESGSSRSARKPSSSIFLLAAAAYASLGVISLSSSLIEGSAALVTALVFAGVGVRFIIRYRSAYQRPKASASTIKRSL
jgi:hypothetical protein